MQDAKENIVHALNYSLFMQLIKYSESVLYKHESLWDELIFTPELLIKKTREIEQLLQISPDETLATYMKVIQSFQECRADDLYIMTIRDPLYPKLLKGVRRPPAVLFLRGKPSFLTSPAIAVVGTRKPSVAGVKRAQRIALELVSHGFTIVSGLALGIDTAAHRATIKAGGQTVAVIGTPIDRSYPPENALLQEQLAESHLMLSQFLLSQPIRRWSFALRNKTMVGLSQATVIVEASVEGGGAKIQGKLCLEAKRPLFIMKSFVSDKVPWTKEFVERGAIVLDDIDTLLTTIGETKQTAERKQIGAFAFAHAMQAVCE